MSSSTPRRAISWSCCIEKLAPVWFRSARRYFEAAEARISSAAPIVAGVGSLFGTGTGSLLFEARVGSAGGGGESGRRPILAPLCAFPPQLRNKQRAIYRVFDPTDRLIGDLWSSQVLPQQTLRCNASRARQPWRCTTTSTLSGQSD